MDLEKDFEKASELINQYVRVIQQVEGASFDNIQYIQQMRKIRRTLRSEMMRQGIADTRRDLRVAPEIRQLALQLDQAMTINSAQGNYLEEFNAAFQLYDLLNDYKGEPEKYTGKDLIPPVPPPPPKPPEPAYDDEDTD